MPDDAVGLLFNEITAERGGLQTFSVVELSLARQLAMMLANPASKADPAVVARLVEMLPPKSAEPSLDLSRLSDKLHLKRRAVFKAAQQTGHGRSRPTTRMTLD
jgi:hypothetical protein